MFRKLSIGLFILTFVFFVIFLFSCLSAGFLVALPNLKWLILCIFFAIVFTLLADLQEKVEMHEKDIKSLQENLLKLEDKVKNINKDGE